MLSHTRSRLLPIAGAALLAGCVALPWTERPPEGAPRLQDDLSAPRHPVTTDSALAQRYFDQGLMLTFAFNHDAAVNSFRAATELDPECAMCFWGIALALGPNINAPMGPEAARQAYAAIEAAQRLSSGVTEGERVYIQAQAGRYAEEPPEDRAELDLTYARAMWVLTQRYPDDLDAATLHAEALMDLYPWNYWTDAGEPREHTEMILSLLESVLEREPGHAGANHYYIHATEEFFPERAEAAADRLRARGLDAGHLVHMPSHIYWRVGRYDDAAQVNLDAAAADEAFFAWCRAGAFYRAAYYPHNIHFLWAAASTQGQSALALTAARKLEAEVDGGLGELSFLQEFASMPILTLVRFGKWDAILGEPAPNPRDRYLVAIRHYARGIALTRTGQLEAAGAELEQLRAVAAEPASETLILAGGTASARALLGVGSAHLDGELRAASADVEGSLAALRRAVELQDQLVYMEPPPWYFPTRQALGAALLGEGQAKEAEVVYRKDLEQYPKNGWSLFGLAASLQAQGRSEQADWASQGHQSAWARADVELSASRF